jgi:hypothetical protein
VYTALSDEHDLQDRLNDLQAHLKHRKTVHKSVRNRLAQDEKRKIPEERKKTLKIGKEASTVSLEAEQIELLDEEEDDVPLHREALDRHEEQEGGRGEPRCWRDLDDDVEICVDRNDDEGHWEDDTVQNPPIQQVNTTQRNAFLLAWVNKANSTVPNTGLQCPLCITDDTQPDKAKNTTYSLAKLNMHLGSGTHARRSQLMRAFNIETKTVKASMIRCPLCGLRPKGRGSATTKFITHIEELHPEELWEVDPEVILSEEPDPEDENVPTEDEDVLDMGEGHDGQPGTSYKGKGKAAVRD